MSLGQGIVELVSQRQDLAQFRKKTGRARSRNTWTWQSAMQVTRNAFERVYDMIMSYGMDTYEVGAKNACITTSSTIRKIDGRDAVFGLDEPLEQLVNALQECRPRATASKSACSCCTDRSAAARARSLAC